MAQDDAPEAGSMIGSARYFTGAVWKGGTMISRVRVVRAGLASLFFAGIAAAADTPRGPFTVWAIGLPNGYIVMEYQARVVHVTAEDAARGVVEVRGGSRLIVTTHAPSRYAVDFFNHSTVFRPIAISGMGNVIGLTPKGGSVTQQQPAGRHIVAVDYRFVLAPGTPPGTYPWPLGLVVRSEPAVRWDHGHEYYFPR
jgi:hypothetical protein